MYWRSYRKGTGSRKREKTPLEKALDKLRKLISEYIRKRDVNEKWYGYCCTCYMMWKLWGRQPKPIHRKEGDAGHFVGRTWKSTIYNFFNLHLQCRNCNRMEHGEQELHGKYIDLKYGEGTAKALQLEKHQQKKRTLEEVEAMIEHVKKLIQEIHEQRGRDKRRTKVNAPRRDPNIMFDWL